MKRLLASLACALTVAISAPAFADGACAKTVKDAVAEMVTNSDANGYAVNTWPEITGEAIKPMLELLASVGKLVDADSFVVSEAVRKSDGEKHRASIVIAGKGGCFASSFMLPREMVERAVGTEG